MTTTPAPSTDAVQIGDTIASLQGLVTAYSNVLEQAKAQLEQLELTPDQMQQLKYWLKDNVSYSYICDMLADKIRYLHSEDESMEARRYRGFIAAIEQRVTANLTDATLAKFADEIQRLVNQERLDAMNRFKELTQSYMDSLERRRIQELQNENHNLKRTLRQVLNLAFDESELNAMAAQAMVEPTTTSTDSANA